MIIDDHVVFAKALQVLISAEPDLAVVAAVSDAPSAMEVAERTRPDLALLDLDLGQDDGVALANRLKVLSPSIRLLFVTGHERPAQLLAAVRSGASGWVSKSAPLPELLATIRGVLRGETWIPPRLLTGLLSDLVHTQQRREVRDELSDRLTSRELDVLRQMVNGLDRRAIAETLHLSVNTVRTHIQNLMTKLEAHSALEAMALALEHGIVEPALTPFAQ